MDSIGSTDIFICNIDKDFCFLRIAGGESGYFLQTMLSADVATLEFGKSVPSLILNSEADIIDQILLIKSGDNEYILVTNSANNEEVFRWLKAHAKIEDDAGCIFGDIEISDESNNISTLLLGGATKPQPQPKPKPLDDILSELSLEKDLLSSLIQFNVFDAEHGLFFLLYFGSDIAIKVLTDFFLSFPELEVFDAKMLKEKLFECNLWIKDIDAGEYIKADLNLHSLFIRKTLTFVGAQKL